jgi:hypothetical protein
VPAGIDERPVGGRAGIGVHRLDRVDQHAGDVAALGQHLERPFGHVGERQRVVGRPGIADAGLNVAPPAVIGAAEAHDAPPPGPVLREAHRLHHGLRPGHVERDLVHPGDRPQPADVVGHDRVQGAEHRPQRLDRAGALSDAGLVGVGAEHVHAVGAGEIVEAVAVEIRDLDAGRGLQEAPGGQVLPDDPAELERHAVAPGELQVGDAAPGLVRRRAGLRVALAVEGGQAREAGAATGGDRVRGAVDSGEFRLAVLVEGQLGGDPARHPDMARERGVLRPRQGEALAALHTEKRKSRCGGRDRDGSESIHPVSVNQRHVTG